MSESKGAQMAGSGFAFRLTQHSQNRQEKTGREQSRCAQPGTGTGRSLSSCFPSAVPRLAQEGTAPAHAPRALQPWFLLPARIAAVPLSGDAGSSQSSAAIAGPWCPAVWTQQRSGTIHSLHTFPSFWSQMFPKAFSFPPIGDHAELQRNAGGGRRGQKCFPRQRGERHFRFRKLLGGAGKPPDFSLLLTQISVEFPLSLLFCSDSN